MMLEDLRRSDDEAAARDVLSALQSVEPRRKAARPTATAVRDLVGVIASIRAAFDTPTPRAAAADVDVVVWSGDEVRLVEAKTTSSAMGREPTPLPAALHASVLRLVGRFVSGRTQAFFVHMHDPSLLPAMERAVPRVAELLEARRRELSDAQISGLVNHFLGDDPIRSARQEIEWSNACERARYLKETPTFTSEEVAAQAGHMAGNQNAAASRFKSRGAVFSVSAKGRELYPAFQFQDGRPRPVIGRILKTLPEEMSPWQRAFWFEAANGWLDGDAPVARLADEDLVLDAARREGEPAIG